jgi:nucleoid DNA-binding protein
MNPEKCIKQISEKLEIDINVANKIYDKFWDFIFETIARDGSAEIEGFGTFQLEPKQESKKKEFILNFKASGSLYARLDI